jgi:hypothetical protein
MAEIAGAAEDHQDAWIVVVALFLGGMKVVQIYVPVRGRSSHRELNLLKTYSLR